MPPQIKRLLPLFIIFIGLFLVVRHLLIPESFGINGHYRANSLDENAAVRMNYAGHAYCVECHDDVEAEKSQDAHLDLSCEVCHGPGLAHAEDPENSAVLKPVSREHCGLCHFRHPAKKQNVIVQIDPMGHYPEKTCVECHNPHQPWDLKIQDNPEENF